MQETDEDYGKEKDTRKTSISASIHDRAELGQQLETHHQPWGVRKKVLARTCMIAVLLYEWRRYQGQATEKGRGGESKTYTM